MFLAIHSVPVLRTWSRTHLYQFAAIMSPLPFPGMTNTRRAAIPSTFSKKNIFNFRSKYVYFCSFCLNPKLKIMLKTDLVYLVIQTNEMISILSLDFFRLKNSPGGLGSQHLLKIHFKFLFNFENFRDKMLNLFHKVSAAFPNRRWWCCVEVTKVHFHKTSIYLRQDSK